MNFVDSHTHLELFAFMKIPFNEITSLKELKEYINEAEEDVILAWGWDEDRLGFQIERKHIEDVRKPVLLIRLDGHVGVVNGAMLEMIGSPKHGRYDPERGYLYEDLLWHVIGRLKPKGEKMKTYLRRGLSEAKRKGIVEIHDYVDEELARLYLELEDLPLDIVLMPYYESYRRVIKLLEGRNLNRLKLGWVKVYVDGSIGARTAYLKEPYRDRPGWKGLLLKDREEIAMIVNELEERGLRISLHAIGDGAIEECLLAFEKVKHRLKYHRIEHAELITYEQALRAKEMDILLCVQPNFKPLFFKTYLRALGEERTERICPIGMLDELGVDMIFGSDMMPFDPNFGLTYAEEVLGEERAKYYYGGWRYEGRYL